jgi:hypothetical protein
MEPISLIVAALATGASSGALAALSDEVKDAVKAAYTRLRGLVKKRVAGNAVAETALDQYEADPKVWEAPLTDQLTKAGAGDDADILAAARELMELLKQAGGQGGTYNVTVSGGQGVQVGSGNAQTNTFNNR